MIERNGLSSVAVRQQEEERRRRQQRIDFALRNEPNTSTSVANDKMPMAVIKVLTRCIDNNELLRKSYHVVFTQVVLV